jgi:cystathionine beta-lyase/cystathionine gamma-synthase
MRPETTAIHRGLVGLEDLDDIREDFQQAIDRSAQI